MDEFGEQCHYTVRRIHLFAIICLMFFWKFPRLLPDTVATWQSKLTKKNITKYGKRWDAPHCSDCDYEINEFTIVTENGATDLNSRFEK